MKAKLHFDSFGHVNNLPQERREEHFKRGGVAGHAPLPAGTIIDHPDAWQLVINGHAEPADDECRRAAGMSPAQIERERIAFRTRMPFVAGQMRSGRRAPANLDEGVI